MEHKQTMSSSGVHRTLRFGPFELLSSKRVLRRDGVTLSLGSRAFDILSYLAERPGKLIGKKELIDHVWSDVTVEEGSLRVHVAAIRKALEDGQFGNRYIASVKGRGYSFIESVVRLEDSTEQRRLAAILAADVVGYSALLQRAEEATYVEFERLKREVIAPSLSRHEGRLIKTTGDGALAEFASPLAAMRCAVEIQDHLASGGSPLRLRVGLNLGDVIVGQDGDLYGDGMNIAVRLEGIADAGGILISEKVYSEVEGKLDVGFEDRGEQKLKNISKPIRAYAVCTGAHSAPIEKLGAAQTAIPASGPRTQEVVFFGPFRLFPSERVLKKADETVKLGSRAFDILLVLVQHAGEVVGQRELIAKVWPGLFVEEVTLRVHVTALRKALDTGEGGERYLT